MKKVIHLTIFLAIVAALAGAALGFANHMTAPVIAKNDQLAETQTLHKIYKDASFELVDQNVSKTIQKIFKVKGKGYIFKLKVRGYKDGTTFLVALNPDGTVHDYLAISNGDTQDIGTKVTGEPFRKTLLGANALNGDVLNDTISGATISSKPVVEGIAEAAKYQADHLK